MVTDEFFQLGKAETVTLGMSGLPLIDIPHPMAGQPQEKVAQIAVKAIQEIIHVLTGNATDLETYYRTKTVIHKKKMRNKTLFADQFSSPNAPRLFRAPNSLEAVNNLFLSRGWTDGLPIIPPTEERLKKFLGDSAWDRREMLGFVPPCQGEATVEKLAVNSIMAGCTPDLFPVVVAATKAMLQEGFNLYGIQTTTHLCTVLVIVNGPLVDKLRFNCSYNAMGQGVRANAVVGRAIRFILVNIGGALPGVLDRATLGGPAKYTFCLAENEEESPWDPLHVERGFAQDVSTVTVVGAEGPHNVNDHGSQNAEEILTTIAGVLGTPGTNHIYLSGEPLIIIGPEHAAAIARDGFSKLMLKQFLHEHGRVPFSLISPGNLTRFAKIKPDRFAGLKPGDRVPLAERAEDIMVVVAGGAGRHSAVIPTFGTTRAITGMINGADGQPIRVKE